jgi:hypothetical protein
MFETSTIVEVISASYSTFLKSLAAIRAAIASVFTRLFATCFDALAAFVAELVLVSGKTIQNPTAAAIDAGAEFLHVVMACSPLTSLRAITLCKCGR